MMHEEQQRVWDILSTPYESPNRGYEFIRHQVFMGNGDQHLMVTGVPTMVAINGQTLTLGTDYVMSAGSLLSTISFSRPMTYGDVVTLY